MLAELPRRGGKGLALISGEQLGEDDAQRPAVDDEMMRDQAQAGLAGIEPEQAEPKQRPRGEVEGQLRQALAEPPPGCFDVSAGLRLPGSERDRHGGADLLVASVAGKGGAQGLVPGDDRAYRGAEPNLVDIAFDLERDLLDIGPPGLGRELAHQPKLALSLR